MKYILGRELVVIKLLSPTRGSATSTWQSVEFLTPAEPLKFLINFFGMKTMMYFKSLSTSVVCLYLIMY